jgi:hypothetical protein
LADYRTFRDARINKQGPGSPGSIPGTSIKLLEKGITTMTHTEIYQRLLTELHYAHGRRSTAATRLQLQDVLAALNELASKETGLSNQDTQDEGEFAAVLSV